MHSSEPYQSRHLIITCADWSLSKSPRFAVVNAAFAEYDEDEVDDVDNDGDADNWTATNLRVLARQHCEIFTTWKFCEYTAVSVSVLHFSVISTK